MFRFYSVSVSIVVLSAFVGACQSSEEARPRPVGAKGVETTIASGDGAGGSQSSTSTDPSEGSTSCAPPFQCDKVPPTENPTTKPDAGPDPVEPELPGPTPPLCAQYSISFGSSGLFPLTAPAPFTQAYSAAMAGAPAGLIAMWFDAVDSTDTSDTSGTVGSVLTSDGYYFEPGDTSPIAHWSLSPERHFAVDKTATDLHIALAADTFVRVSAIAAEGDLPVSCGAIENAVVQIFIPESEGAISISGSTLTDLLGTKNAVITGPQADGWMIELSGSMLPVAFAPQ